MAEKKCKALRQSDQLYTPANTDLHALITTPTAANTGTVGPMGGNKSRSFNRAPKPAWYDHPPTSMQQTHALDGRTWHWCPKCGTNGKWVCTHHPSQHGDTFVKKRRSEGATHNRDKRPTPRPTCGGTSVQSITGSLATSSCSPRQHSPNPSNL